MRVSFSETVSVTFDGAGNGTVNVGPQSAREKWFPDSAHVQVSSDVNESLCNLYVGPSPDRQYFRDATASGSLGDTTSRIGGTGFTTPIKVWAVWTGGDAKATGTLTVVGEKEI